MVTAADIAEDAAAKAYEAAAAAREVYKAAAEAAAALPTVFAPPSATAGETEQGTAGKS